MTEASTALPHPPSEPVHSSFHPQSRVLTIIVGTAGGGGVGERLAICIVLCSDGLWAFYNRSRQAERDCDYDEDDDDNSNGWTGLILICSLVPMKNDVAEEDERGMKHHRIQFSMPVTLL